MISCGEKSPHSKLFFLFRQFPDSQPDPDEHNDHERYAGTEDRSHKPTIYGDEEEVEHEAHIVNVDDLERAIEYRACACFRAVMDVVLDNQSPGKQPEYGRKRGEYVPY